MPTVTHFQSKSIDMVLEYNDNASTWLYENLDVYPLLVKMVPEVDRYEFCTPSEKHSLLFVIDTAFHLRAYKHDIWNYHKGNFFAASKLDPEEYKCTYIARHCGPGWEQWIAHINDNDNKWYSITTSFEDEYDAILFKLNV
jgi:hypothetical protein